MSAGTARTLLFVPGDRPDRFERAHKSGADAVILDLQDAVAHAHKPAALRNIVTWLGSHPDTIVRINPAAHPRHAEEVRTLGPMRPVLMVPIAEDAPSLRSLSVALPDARMLPLVETSLGIVHASEIAKVPGVIRLVLGTIDLAVNLRIDPDSVPGLAHARGVLVTASAAAGIAAPVDGITARLDDPNRLRADAAHARELGFRGKLCIHPRQVTAINDAFLPSASEVNWATRVLGAATTEDGAILVDGAMVDRPVIERARWIFDLHQQSRV